MEGRPQAHVLSQFLADNRPNMLIFYDCEFTDPLPGAGLISIALVAEDDDCEPLYLELNEGWGCTECSTFVLTNVLPLLGRHNPLLLSRAAAAARIEAWLDGLRGGDRTVQLALLSDSDMDWQQLLGLFPVEPGEKPWPAAFNATGRVVLHELLGGKGEPRVFNEAMEEYFQRSAPAMVRRGGERHHALIDALAIKHAWRAAVQEG